MIAKKIFVSFFISFIYKPARIILRIIFYKIIVKLYSLYYSLIKKIGWKRLGGDFFAFMFGQKLVHVLVIIMSGLIVLYNLMPRTRADELSANINKTIISGFIKNELGDGETDGSNDVIKEEISYAPVKQNYLNSLGTLKNLPKTPVDQNTEETDQGSIATTQGGTTLIKPEIASTLKTKRERKDTIIYAVKIGDTISTIADEFNIGVNTILWENNLTAFSIIKPGDNLRILPISGINYSVQSGDTLAEVAKKFGVNEQNILAYNNISGQLRIGDKILIPGGRKQNSYQLAEQEVQTPYTGLNILRDLVRIPIERFSKKSDVSPRVGNKMMWPTVGYRITQYYHFGHSAIDIANHIGTPIYAADSGTIEFMGWSNGYGNNIVINHGGGKKTRYAHLSQFFVSRGDHVGKGENIAAMGNTGRSTGPHVHFEVMINGVKYNPLNYVR